MSKAAFTTAPGVCGGGWRRRPPVAQEGDIVTRSYKTKDYVIHVWGCDQDPAPRWQKTIGGPITS